MAEVWRDSMKNNPWPQGDATLKRLLDLGYTRARIAEELSRELRMRITDDQVTNRGKRKGWIVVCPSATRMPKEVVVVPQRLGNFTSSKITLKRAKTCQQPMWNDKDDESYGMYCGLPCDGKSSYCAAHHTINAASTLTEKVSDSYAARQVISHLDSAYRKGIRC